MQSDQTVLIIDLPLCYKSSLIANDTDKDDNRNWINQLSKNCVTSLLYDLLVLFLDANFALLLH